jgi:hypothetical protein
MKGKKNPSFLAIYLNHVWKIGNCLRLFFEIRIFAFFSKKKIIEFVRRKFQNFATLHKKRLTPMPFF